jgi:hypothetical protein
MDDDDDDDGGGGGDVIDRIDAPQALPLLPSDTPVAKLMPFLTAILTRNRHLRRNNQVFRPFSFPFLT